MHLKPTLKSNMNHFFDPTNQPNSNITMGLITLEPGEKHPKQGYSYHKQIEKMEGHINYNDSNEPAIVVWFFVERKEEK